MKETVLFALQGGQKNGDRIDVDGLPHIGAVIYPKQGYYSKMDSNSGRLTSSQPPHLPSYFACHEGT